MVGRSAYDRESGGVVHAILEGNGLEGLQTLVVVHRQRRIEETVLPDAEITVGREGTVSEDTLILGLLDGRDDDLLLFVAQQSAVAAVGVQAQYCDLGVVDAEIPLQGSLHQTQFAEDLLFGDAGGDILQRDVTRHDADLERIADHQHRDILDPESILEILRMACITETFPGHRFLVEGGGDQDVDVAFLDVADSPFQCGHGRFRGFGRGLSGLYENIVRQAVDNVDSAGVRLFGGADHVGVQLVYLMDQLLIEAEYLGGSVDDGRE